MDQQADTPFFEARLLPHRSMGARGAFWLVAGIGALWGAASLSFAAMGAWPVIGFFGLDIVLLAILMRMNLQDARRREDVSLSRTTLEIRRFDPRGMLREMHRFNPFGTRLHVERHAEFGVMKLTLANRGDRVTVGDFLNPDDKESFAKAFSAALAKARH